MTSRNKLENSNDITALSGSRLVNICSPLSVSSGKRIRDDPGVVLEVCYPQKSKSVSYLADDYILNTDGSINIVITLDIDYQGSQRASFTVWKPDCSYVNGLKELRAKAIIEAEVYLLPINLTKQGTQIDIGLSKKRWNPCRRGGLADSSTRIRTKGAIAKLWRYRTSYTHLISTTL